MYSYEDRLRAVRLYIRPGLRVGATIRQLGYPTKNSLKSWHREYEQRHDLAAGYARHPGSLQAMVRDRVVADDWFVAVDSNRYSVPFALIGKTVQVVREGGAWVIRHRGAVVAEHAVLAGRGQLSVRPEHGPGAAARNARQRYSAPRASATTDCGPAIHPTCATQSSHAEHCIHRQQGDLRAVRPLRGAREAHQLQGRQRVQSKLPPRQSLGAATKSLRSPSPKMSSALNSNLRGIVSDGITRMTLV